MRWLCDRLLSLNGIKPEWVSSLQLSELIFDGLLLQVNRLKQTGKQSETSDEPLTTAQLIAQALLVTDGDMEAAIAIVEHFPSQMAVDLIEAIVETRKTPEELEKDKFQKWKTQRMKQRE